jgi:hypothetical protein
MNQETTTMNSFARRLVIATPLLMAICGLNSCETVGDSGTDSYSYYSSGFHDPWYYGDYYDDPDIIVSPPGDWSDGPMRPAHPIARPPMAGPRPMPHMGGGRGGGGGFRR